MVGWTLLVVVVAVGLAQLAVRCRRCEFVLGSVVVGAVAVPVALVAPGPGLLMVLSTAGASRLRAVPVVPDRLPADWS